MVLKWRDINTENIRVVSLVSGLKIEGIVKGKDLKLQGPLYTVLIVLINVTSQVRINNAYIYKMPMQ